MGSPSVSGSKNFQRFDFLYKTLKNILSGFDNQVVMNKTLKDLIDVLRDPELPFGQWTQQSSALHTRIPQRLDTQLSTLVEKAKNKKSDFPARQLLKLFDKYIPQNPTDAMIFNQAISPLVSICNQYSDGLVAHEFKVMNTILEEYYNVEKLFSQPNLRDEDAILRLRDEHREDIKQVVMTILSHSRVGAKNNLVLAILNEFQPSKVDSVNIAKYMRASLKNIVELESRSTQKVVLKAREILIQCSLPSLRERSDQLEHILRSSVVDATYGEIGYERRSPKLEVLREVIDSRYNVFDVLDQFFVHPDPYVVLAALEVYVRRACRAYTILDLKYHSDTGAPPIVSWKFKLSSLAQATFNTMTQTESSNSQGKDISRSLSVSDLTFMADKFDQDPVRSGVIAPAGDFDEIDEILSNALEYFPENQVVLSSLVPMVLKVLWPYREDPNRHRLQRF